MHDDRVNRLTNKIYKMNYKYLFNSKLIKRAILLIGLLPPVFLFAQTEIQKDSLVKVPQAIEISEITNYSQVTRTLIEETQELASNKTKVLRIHEGLTELDSIMASKLLLLRDTLSYFNLDQLDKLEDRMGLYKKRVDLWKSSNDVRSPLASPLTKTFENIRLSRRSDVFQCLNRVGNGRSSDPAKVRCEYTTEDQSTKFLTILLPLMAF